MFGIRKDPLGASLEKQAVAKAISTHYGTNLHEHALNRFVQAVGALAHTNRETPGAQRYLNAITSFRDPHLTRGHVDRAAMDLIHSGLIGLADRAMQRAKVKGHQPLPAPLANAEQRGKSGFIELPESEQTHLPSHAEVEFALSQHNPAKIQKATDETVRPFDMRRKLPLEASLNTPPDDDGETPIPLALEKGEIGAKGKRHADISRMIGEQKSSNDIVKHLMERYTMTERNAKAQLARWLKLKSEGKVAAIEPTEKPAPEEPLRLARVAARRLTNRAEAWFFRVKLARPIENHKAAVNETPHDSLGWRTLADNMEDHGEPNAPLIRAQGDAIANDAPIIGQVHNPDGPPKHTMAGDAAQAILHSHYTDAPFTYRAEGNNSDWHVYSYGHGRLGGYSGIPAVVVRYQDQGEGGLPISAYAQVTPENFNEVLRDAPQEVRKVAHKRILHHYPLKGKQVKLAREKQPPKERPGQTRPEKEATPTDLTRGVDPHIAGTRLAYHLTKIIKDTAPPIAPTYSDTEKTSKGAEGGGYYPQDADPNRQTVGAGGHLTAHELAKAALAGRGLKGANGDVYAALGRHLTSIGHPLANAYNWHTMDRSMSEDDFLKRFLAKHVTRPEGMSDAEFYRKVVKQFAYEADDPNAEAKHNREDFVRFWNRLKEAYKRHPLGLRETGDVGGKWGDSKWRTMLKRFTNSMYRNATLAEEREDQGNAKTRDVDVRKVDADKAKKVGWRDWLSKLWNSKHMKFQRTPLERYYA